MRPCVTKSHPPTNSQKSNRVLAYARVSSKEQETEGFSIAAQQKLLQAYASGKGLRIEKEFVDVETAKASGRASFTEMVDARPRAAIWSSASR